MTYLNESNAKPGDLVEISGDPAKIVEVIPGLGIVIDTIGAGMKLRITYLFTELGMRGAKHMGLKLTGNVESV